MLASTQYNMLSMLAASNPKVLGLIKAKCAVTAAGAIVRFNPAPSAVRTLPGRATAITAKLMADRRFDRKPPILSGAGSTWFDVVPEVFSSAEFPQRVEIVLRPGCYLTHDAGFYREAHARILNRNPVARRVLQGLRPALQVWAYAQSVPEEAQTIIGIGKRDASFDLGLPMQSLHFRPDDENPHYHSLAIIGYQRIAHSQPTCPVHLLWGWTDESLVHFDSIPVRLSQLLS